MEKTLTDLFIRLYSEVLYPLFIFIMRPLVNGWLGLVILIIILIILSSVSKMIKNARIYSSIISFLCVVASLMLVGALVLRLIFYIDDLPEYQNTATDSDSNSSSTSGTTNSSGSESTTTPQQTTKQLYYSASCSSCYNEGCNRNGYSYGGYSEQSYLYYKNLCQSCGCANSRSQSFWK